MSEYINGVLVGGSSATYTDYFWSPETPPETANALDDEFDSGALAGWSDYDFGGVGTNVVSASINKLEITLTKSASGEENTGLYRASPVVAASDYSYTIWTRGSIGTEDLTDYPNISLVAGLNMANSGDAFYAISLLRATSNWIVLASRYDAWNVFGATLGTVENIQTTHIYFRIRVRYLVSTDTTSLFFDYSSDGVGWKSLNSGVAHNLGVGVELESIGMTINNSTAIATEKSYGFFDFFRVYDGFAFDATAQGRLVKSVLGGT